MDNIYLSVRPLNGQRRAVADFQDYRRLAKWQEPDKDWSLLLQCKRDGSLWVVNTHSCVLGFVPNTDEIYFRAILTPATLEEIHNV